MPPSNAGALWKGVSEVLGFIACMIGLHSCRTESDDNGVWGECVRCHRRFGYVDRYTLRNYAEAEHQARMSKDAEYRAQFESECG